jgi:hypothetical protein
VLFFYPPCLLHGWSSMSDKLLNFDFHNSSDEELRHWLLQMYPLVKKFLEGAVRFCALKQLSCEGCPKKIECDRHNKYREDKTCLMVEPYLPGRFEGASRNEKKIGLLIDKISGTKPEIFEDADYIDNVAKLDRGKFKSVKKISSLDVFKEYEKCWRIFSHKQQPVLILRHRDRKTIIQIGKELGKAQSTVWGLLKNAEELKQAYDDKELEKIVRLKKRIRTD